MVYKSRPEVSDAQLAWDRFTVLHEAEPVEMEFLNGEEMWRFCYLDSGDRSTEVRLGAAGLEAVGAPDPDKLLRIKSMWESAATVRDNVGRLPRRLGYLFFVGATVSLAAVTVMSLQVLRRWSNQTESPVHSNVQFALIFLGMCWLMLAAQHLVEWWRKIVPPRSSVPWIGGFIFMMMSFGMLQLLESLGQIPVQ